MYRLGQFDPKFEMNPAIFSQGLNKISEEEGLIKVWDILPEHDVAAQDKWSTNAATINLKYQISAPRFSEVEENTSELSTKEGNEDRTTDLISKIRTTGAIPDREAIFQRLFELVQDLRDEEPESTGISFESLRSFYSFLQGHSYLKKPAIGLTPTNEIYVSWIAGQDSVFSIHFLESGLARFAIIAPSTRPEEKVGLSGTANIKDLVDKVRPWGVIKWAEREEQYSTTD